MLVHFKEKNPTTSDLQCLKTGWTDLEQTPFFADKTQEGGTEEFNLHFAEPFTLSVASAFPSCLINSVKPQNASVSLSRFKPTQSALLFTFSFSPTLSLNADY